MQNASTTPFKAFRAKFARLISDPTFGEPRHAPKDKVSAAGRELHRTGLVHKLASTEFCKSLYALYQESLRLEREREKVFLARRRLRPLIRRYVNLKRRLENCASKLSDVLDAKNSAIIDGRISQKVSAAISLVREVAGEIDQRTRILVSNLHPRHRKEKDEPSNWVLLFREYRYDLEKLGVKAEDRWFLVAVNRALLEFLERQNLSISAMTRFKVIAAISTAAGNEVEPSAVKQFFVGKYVPVRKKHS